MKIDSIQAQNMRRARVLRAWPVVAMLATAIVLAGCESPLRLEGVEAQKAAPIRRSDMFQQAAVSDRTLVVVGTHGLVLRSSDAGGSWLRQELAGWPSLIDVAACPDGRLAALAAESQVLVSTDDGGSWQAHAIPTEESPQAVTCDPANRLWVVGSFSTIIVSDDGGATWDDRSIGEDTILTTIQFIDANRAVVFGEFGTNYRSADGGATWTAGPPLPDGFYAQDAYFSDATTGWVTGLAGQILHTADGGSSWTLEPAETQVPIYAVVQQDGRTFAAGGEGALLERREGSWIRVEHGRTVRQLLRVLQPLAGGRLLIGGAAGALHVVSTPERAARAS